MFYKILTIRTPKDGIPSSLPSLGEVSIKPFGTYNPKIGLYILEGEGELVPDAFNKLAQDPRYLVHTIFEGETPLPLPTNSVWIWKQVAKLYSDNGLGQL